MSSRRDEALRLAEELLSNIELEEIRPVSVIRKASRLARLLDDSEATTWLSFEIGGYPSTGNGKGLSSEEWKAAKKSGRAYYQKDSAGEYKEVVTTLSLSSLEANVESSKARLKSSKSSDFFERNNQQANITQHQGYVDRILGSVHQYVSNIYHELRFGAAVETAFESLRNDVDSRIASLIPVAIPMLTTALENAQTNNPEQWKHAAQACRDLIKATADVLRPAGPDKNGIKMGESNYTNRLVDWISEQTSSKTQKAMVTSDLEDLGKRLDAATKSGNKGAHASVSKNDASRFIVGTYILLGDILALNG